MLPLIPLHDKVLVVLLPAVEQITAGGVIIPDAVGEQKDGGRGMTQQATVIATGPGRVTRKGAVLPPEVKPMDEVLIRRHMGTELKIGHGRFVVVEPKDILGVIA